MRDDRLIPVGAAGGQATWEPRGGDAGCALIISDGILEPYSSSLVVPSGPGNW